MQHVFVTVGTTFPGLGLASRYHDYHVIHTQRAEQALDLLRQVAQGQIPVILLLVDQHLPDTTGVAFLQQARRVAPAAKSLVVMDPQRTDPLGVLSFTIDAVVTTCMPPEDFLFPVLDALLLQEQRQEASSSETIQVIGHRWSARSHEIKDFFARHAIPFRWVDLEDHPDAGSAVPFPLQSGPTGDQPPAYPLLRFPDGTWLAQPTRAQLAARLGLTMHSEIPFYDLIIVGAGPAGLAAAVYGASEGLHTAVIERDVPGGQAGMSSRIENYLGFPIGLEGAELASRGIAQAARLGAHFLSPQAVTAIRVAEPYRYVTLADGRELGCYALLLSLGVQYRELSVPGMQGLVGAGVYYGAATTEAASCQGKQVCVVGGANSAGQAALFFANSAQQVHLLVRGESLAASMSSYLLQEIASRDNIEVHTQTEVIACQGSSHLEQICLRRRATGTEEVLPADALFIFIGSAPQTAWLPDAIARDGAGFVLAGEAVKAHGWPLSRDPSILETSIPGIFVAGDVRADSFKRVASATGDGAVAVSLIHQYLRTVR